MGKEDSASGYALKQVPLAWYELQPKDFLLYALTSTAAGNVIYDQFIHNHSFATRVTGALLYVMGTVADRLSTAKGLQANENAKELGIKTLHENNIITPNLSKQIDVFTNPKMYAIDTAAIFASAYSLGIAVPLTVFKGVATSSNLRKVKRLNQEVEYMRNLTR